jgi:hypothetical protein
MKLLVVMLTLSVLLTGFRGIMPPTHSAETTTGSVLKYEYCQYYRSYFQDEELDVFGMQGWELVAFNTIGEVPVNANFVGAKEYVATFKRVQGSGMKNCAATRSDALKKK